MIIQRMWSNPHSFRLEKDGPVIQESYAHPIETAVLRQVADVLRPGDIGEFKIIVRRKISSEEQEVTA